MQPRKLQSLIDFAHPDIHVVLRLIENPVGLTPLIATAIAAAPNPVIDLDQFFQALPVPPNPLRGLTFATALDRGLGIDPATPNSITSLYPQYQNEIDRIPNHKQTNRKLRAFRGLSNLLATNVSDHAFRTLVALTGHKSISKAIMNAPHEINPELFIRALPLPPTPLTGTIIAAALDAGLGIAPGGAAGSIAYLYANDFDDERAVINPIANDQPTNLKFQALRRLDNLWLEGKLPEFFVCALDDDIANAILAAPHAMDVARFIAALPLPPAVLNGANIATALDAGLRIAPGGANSIATLYANNVRNVRNAIDPDPVTIEKLSALRLLSNLPADGMFRAVRTQLYALVNHNDIRAAILTGHEINVADFIGALPPPPAVPNGAHIAAALDAGLGIAAGTIAAIYATNQNNAVNFINPVAADANTNIKLKASRALKNLCTDNRIPDPELFLDLARDDHIAAAIATATQELNVAVFIETLPAPPTQPDRNDIAHALDAALGIPAATSITAVPGNPAGFDALDDIADDATTIQRLRASRALKNLMQPSFDFPGLQPVLKELIRHQQIADAIIGANRSIDTKAFIAALPLPGNPLNGAAIATALDAGFQIAAGVNSITTLYNNNAHNERATIDPAVANPITEEKLRALRLLSNLLSDVKIKAVVRTHLYALVNHDQIRAAILGARAINVNDFVAALPLAHVGMSGAHIATALDAGLGIAAAGTIATIYATNQNNAVNFINPVATDASTNRKLQASRALNNLLQDARLANPQVQAALNQLVRIPHIRNAIINSGREIDVNLFISELPLPPNALDGRAIARALDKGFGIAPGVPQSIAAAQVANVPVGIQNALAAVSADVPTNQLLQASRKLSSLMLDPRFQHADAQRTLKALVTNIPQIRDAILAAPNEINVNRFIHALPLPPGALNGAVLSAALDTGLGIPAGGNSIATLYRNHAHGEWAVINPVVATPETKRKLQASRVLHNLMVHPQFRNLDVQAALKALLDEEQIANAIIAAGRDIDMTRFISALPAAGAEIDGHAIAVALDAGLQTNNAITALHDGGLQARFTNIKDAHPETTRTLRVLRALNNLMTDPRFANAAVKNALIALVANQHIADTIIREARDIDVTAFINVLHNAPAMNGQTIAQALDAGFQLAANTFDGFYAGNLHGTPPLFDAISGAIGPDILNLARLTSESQLKAALLAQGIPEPENTVLRQILSDNRTREQDNIQANAYRTLPGLNHKNVQDEKFTTGKYERFLSSALTELERAQTSLHPDIEKIKRIDLSVSKLKADLLKYRIIITDLKTDVENAVAGGGAFPGDADYQNYLAQVTLDAANYIQDCQTRIAEINAYLLRADRLIDRANDILLNPTRAAQNIAYGTKSTLGTAQEFTSYDDAVAAKNTMLEGNAAAPVVVVGVNADQLKSTQRTNTVVAIPINIDVGNEQLKTATIRTINENKNSVKSEIFFNEGVLNKLKNEKRIKQSTGYFTSFSTPGMGAMEWAYQNIQSVTPALKKNHDPISVAAGSGVPQVCIEALVVYCKFKFKDDISKVLNLPYGYRDTVTQEQVDLFAREWMKKHPEDLSEKELEQEERGILELAPGAAFRP